MKILRFILSIKWVILGVLFSAWSSYFIFEYHPCWGLHSNYKVFGASERTIP